jgi:hypothetical protein
MSTTYLSSKPDLAQASEAVNLSSTNPRQRIVLQFFQYASPAQLGFKYHPRVSRIHMPDHGCRFTTG